MIVRGGSPHWFSGERSATDRSQFLAKETIAADLGFRLARVAKTPWKSEAVDGMFSGFVDMAVVNEGGAAKVVISRKGDPVFPMNVSVSCDDSRVQLPASVTFAGGEATKTFAFNVAADLLAHGQREATIMLSPDAGTPLALSLTISDPSASALSIEILSGKAVAGQPATLRILRNAATSVPLGVVVATPQGQQVETIPGSQSHVDVTINVPTDSGSTLLVNASADWHAPASATLNVEQASGFASWAASHGLAGADATPVAIPNGDGIPNLVKYALLMTPGQNGSSGLPRAAMTGPSGNRSLTLSFRRDPSRNDISIVVEAQNELAAAWSEIARSTKGAGFTGLATVSEFVEADGVKSVTVQDIQVNASRRFMRIRVER